MTFIRKRALVASALSVGLLALLPVRPASAWWAAGHAVIAMMAYRQMKPETRAAVDQTLQAHPDYKNWMAELPANITPAQKNEYLFAIASTWPDRIKDNKDQTVGIKFSDPARRNAAPPGPKAAAAGSPYPDLQTHGTWHYYDAPISADHQERTSLPEESALTALPLCEKQLANPATPPSQKAYYLAWVAHLVGDVHQPLHAVSRYSAAYPKGDGGGNAVRFKSDNSANPIRNLHGFWDGLLGSGPDPTRFNTLLNGWDALNATIATIDTEAPRLLAGFDPKAQNDVDEKDWVRESFGIAQEFVYTFGDVDAIEASGGSLPLPDADYRAFATRIAHQRAALAAHRLALVCDAAFAAPPVR